MGHVDSSGLSSHIRRWFRVEYRRPVPNTRGMSNAQKGLRGGSAAHLAGPVHRGPGQTHPRSLWPVTVPESTDSSLRVGPQTPEGLTPVAGPVLGSYSEVRRPCHARCALAPSVARRCRDRWRSASAYAGCRPHDPVLHRGRGTRCTSAWASSPSTDRAYGLRVRLRRPSFRARVWRAASDAALRSAAVM